MKKITAKLVYVWLNNQVINSCFDYIDAVIFIQRYIAIHTEYTTRDFHIE